MTTLRVATHVHSAWSYDASWPLDRIAASFARRGYQAVLMSEHDQGFTPDHWGEYVQACAEASRPGLLLIPGIEYGDADNTVHVPVWGDVPFLGSGHGTLGLLERAREAGAFTVFAHPHRRDAWRRYDRRWAPLLSAVEVWNRKYDGWAPNRQTLGMARGEDLPPFVALDFHTRRQFFPLGVRLEVAGPATVPTVHDALARGAYESMVSRLPLGVTTGAALPALEAVEAARRTATRAVRRVGGSRRAAPGHTDEH